MKLVDEFQVIRWRSKSDGASVSHWSLRSLGDWKKAGHTSVGELNQVQEKLNKQIELLFNQNNLFVLKIDLLLNLPTDCDKKNQKNVFGVFCWLVLWEKIFSGHCWASSPFLC